MEYYYPEKKHLFRGKSEETGEWKVGDRVYLNNGAIFIYERGMGDIKYKPSGKSTIELHKVLESTVGKSFEMYDIEGEELFEGDVVNLNGNRYMLFLNENEVKYKDVDSGEDIEDTGIVRVFNNINALLVGNVFDNPAFQRFNSL